MPSIQQVGDQINARLDQVVTNTNKVADNTAETVGVCKDIRNELVTVNNRLLQLDGTLHNGFANLSNGLFAILQADLAQLEMLDHHRQQNDTIICELVHANGLLCNIMRKLGHLVDIESEGLKSTSRIEGIFERVHPDAAGDYDRGRDLHAKIEECCPPEKPRPEPCPDPCMRPEFRAPQPSGLDWKPLDERRQPDPIG